MGAIMDNILARRSIRHYVDNKPVEREKVELLLQAAMAAPSACNLQPWEFVVVDNPAELEEMKVFVRGGQFNAPMAMVVCARTEYVPWEGNGWQIDCAAAIENMMLAAVEMGLGSLWIGDFDREKVREYLCVPQGVDLVNIVYFGYPAETKRPVTRYKEEAVYWGKYDPNRPHAERTVPQMIQESINDS
ncbi:MAG: nitroreductase family protein [Clostridia bacterium]|nr:nitroreductase family protein [Clostridia bacterium]